MVRCVRVGWGGVRPGVIRRGRHGALSLIFFWQKFVLSNCGEVLKGLVGSEGHGLAGKVLFGEQRFVRAGLIGVS